MKRKWVPLRGVMAAIGLLILIFDSSLALEGAGTGIELCIKTVIPSLFPFFVLSIILTNTLSCSDFYPLQMLAGLLGIPKPAIPVLIPAVLGGYPVGAKCIGDLYERKLLNRKESERLLGFCSNAGPSFLFGMVSGFFPERKMIWFLWIIHLFSAVLTAASFPAVKSENNIPAPENGSENVPAVLSAARAIGLVCCWVILFRTIISFLGAWFFWLFPVWIQVLLMGILELTNGCCALLLITDIKLRFVLTACMISFGGICVLFQTMSVTNGLSLTHYIKGKVIQTVFSLLLSWMIVEEDGLIIALIIPLLVVTFRKLQNSYRNPESFPV